MFLELRSLEGRLVSASAKSEAETWQPEATRHTSELSYAHWHRLKKASGAFFQCSKGFNVALR